MNYAQNGLLYRPINWSRKALIALLALGIISGFTFLHAPVRADEDREVTVPINQVVKTNKLSAEQLTKSKVTVPMSWVNKEYLEEHGYTEENSTQKKQKVFQTTYLTVPTLKSQRSPLIEKTL